MEPVWPGGKQLTLRRQLRSGLVLCCAVLLWAGVLQACFACPQPEVIPATDAVGQTVLEMTPEALGQRIVRLILSIHGKQDMARSKAEKQFGVTVKYNTTDPQAFWISGELVGGSRYSLESISDAYGQPPSRLDVEFFRNADTPAQVGCAHSMALYRQSLIEGGFKAQWVGSPRRGSPARWHFERGSVVVTALTGADKREDDAQTCVSKLMVLVLSSERVP
ncbi:hypothetical protein [Pseudomonas sp. nanlin1]|uniref:hypothetical protein n=1 Tax=Pseudomonas sp. nanlin1 TaxID=3040605 RepID=UPI00388FF6A0